MSGTNTWPSMTHEFVRATVFTQVGTDHLWLDLNSVEGLSIVHADDGADHLRDNNHLRDQNIKRRRHYAKNTWKRVRKRVIEQSRSHVPQTRQLRSARLDHECLRFANES